MGLDFDRAEAHWSYGGFNRFRTRLAKEIGIDLNKMEGFTYDVASGTQRPSISWDTVNDDIKILLMHSDCEGHLTAGECRKIAPRLRELVKGWPDSDQHDPIGYDKRQALLLAEGMEECARTKKQLKFM